MNHDIQYDYWMFLPAMLEIICVLKLLLTLCLEKNNKGERKMIRRKYRFYGRVQGVGFRYRCYHLASVLHLSGNVKNEYDGSVTMEIQGDINMITGMIEKLKSEPFIDITRYTYQNMDVKKERGFQVLY